MENTNQIYNPYYWRAQIRYELGNILQYVESTDTIDDEYLNIQLLHVQMLVERYTFTQIMNNN